MHTTTSTIAAIHDEVARLADELVGAGADQDADALALLARLESDTAAAELRVLQEAHETRLALRARTVELLQVAIAAFGAARDSLAQLASAPPLRLRLSPATRRVSEGDEA
jgi:hypothetical protein